MSIQPVDFDELRSELGRAVHYGARPEALVDHPALVGLLCPAGPDGLPHLADRAITTAGLVADAVRSLEPPADAAMEIMLCLRPGTARLTLALRRRQAADKARVRPATFRCEKRYEQAYVTELALALYQARAAAGWHG